MEKSCRGILHRSGKSSLAVRNGEPTVANSVVSSVVCKCNRMARQRVPRINNAD